MSEAYQYLGLIGPLQFVGVLGFFLYLFAFGGVQLELLNGNSATFSVLNVIAASFVAISLIAEFNLSSALIQGSWIAIGLVGIFKRAFIRKQRGPRPTAFSTSSETS